MHVHQLAGSETHLWATEPLPLLGASKLLQHIMMILNDEVSLNNDPQLKALNMAPYSRATGSFASHEKTQWPLSVCLVLQSFE